MAHASRHDVYFSFFMFTADLRPDDRAYTPTIVRHMRELLDMGYDGFDLPIAPKDTQDHAAEVAHYVELKRALDEAGLGHVPFTTNVGATPAFNPASPDPEQRAAGLAYLKSRVDITAALGGKIMAGPIIFPYGLFPTDAQGEQIWSDALQDWVVPGYRDAQPVLEALGDYAESKGIKLAIEPVDHWETAAPNLVSDVMRFLRHVQNYQVGVCVDSAHVVLGSDGRGMFDADMNHALATKRLHYVHISAPDRGALRDSWIPWSHFLRPIASYDGPFLVEVFNAIEPFPKLLRITRRKFWVPGEDTPVLDWPSAYDVAREGLATVRKKLAEMIRA